MKIYLTGVSGTGKSSIIRALRSRGIRAVDLDDGLCHRENKHTGERVDWQPGKSNEWYGTHVWLCDEKRLTEILAQNDDIVVAGLASNQNDYLHLFDKVFILTSTPETIRTRLLARVDSDFGKHPAEQKRILNWHGDFEKEMRAKGAVALDAERPLEEVVSDVVAALEEKFRSE